jgi:hypothetical protein
MIYLLVGTLHSKTLHLWKFMGVEEFFMHISFIVDAVIALRALTCAVISLFKIMNAETAIWYPKYTPYFVSDQQIVLFCSCITSSVHDLKENSLPRVQGHQLTLCVVLWVESHVIIMLQYDVGMLYLFCDNPCYVILSLFHVTAFCAACAAISFCHEVVSTGFGFDVLKLLLGL